MQRITAEVQQGVPDKKEKLSCEKSKLKGSL